MKLQEKRHGPLNSTHDASLDELSEVRILYLFETRKTLYFFEIISVEDRFSIDIFRFYHLSDHQMEKVLYLQSQ